MFARILDVGSSEIIYIDSVFKPIEVRSLIRGPGQLLTKFF